MDEAARLAAAKRFGFRVTLAMVAGRDARNAPAAARADLCHALVVIALEEKDADLARGLGADGAALVPISERTRVHRRSAMGLADPDAPPLTPAWGLSRTRSFLVGEAAPNADGADFWWMWDAREDVPWGQVLDHHRQGLGRLPVRDVFGCGPACLGRIRARLTAWWLLYRKGQAPALVRQPPVPPEPPPKWAWKAVKPYQPKFPELAVPKKPRRVSQLNVNGRVYTFGASAGGKVSAAGLKRGVANGTFSGFHRWDPETGQLIRPRPGPGPGPGPRPVKPPPPPPPAPRFRPAENAGDRVTVVVDAARLDAAWRRDPDFYVPPGGREEDRQKYANNVAFVARARREGLAIEQPRITVDADGAASFIDGRHRFAALRDAGVESVPVSVDPEEAARARRVLGADGPLATGFAREPGTGPRSSEGTGDRQANIARAASLAEAEGFRCETTGYDLISRRMGKAVDDLVCVYFRDLDVIAINERDPYWDDPAASIRAMYEKGYASTDHPDHAIRHEIGHGLNLRGLTDEQADVLVNSRTLRDRARDLGASVSDRARMNAAELIAEVHAGLRDGRSYSEAVRGFYNRWGGRDP